MLFSFLIASVSTGPTNTTSIGPSPTPINIYTNRCGIDGAVDHEFLVTLKQDVANSDGRRLDTTEDKLSFLQGWVAQYTVDQHEGTYSNGTTRRKLEANSRRRPSCKASTRRVTCGSPAPASRPHAHRSPKLRLP